MDIKSLIGELKRDGYLKSPRLIKAFSKIKRIDFVPKELWGEAYGNYPLPIGEGQTISQPLTVAFMLELLEPRPGEKILEIGAGSGWQTALLAYAVSSVKSQGSSGLVVAVERIPELAKMAERNISKYNFIEKGIVKIILGDGSLGAPLALRPVEGFDKIIAAAAIASPRTDAERTQTNAESQRKSASSRRESAMRDFIPHEWKKQLKVGGRIVAPVLTSIVVLDKIGELEPAPSQSNGFKEKEYFGFSFVPLVRD